jgi:hypothetical protein
MAPLRVLQTTLLPAVGLVNKDISAYQPIQADSQPIAPGERQLRRRSSFIAVGEQL